MNSLTIVGKIDSNPGINTIGPNSTRVLHCTVAVAKHMPSGKTYTEKFRISVFGKNIDTVLPQIPVGTLVGVVGEVGLDIPKDPKYRPQLKLTTFNISVLGQSQSAAAQREPEPVKETETDEIPF